MPHDRLENSLDAQLRKLEREGRLKGAENVTTEIVPPREGRGPRIRLEGEGDRLFLRMNSNGYLGMARRPELAAAAAAAVDSFGTGPAAVRFISGTHAPHIALEARLAAFHGRESALIWSSGYAAVMGILPPLVDDTTAVISDELNHNSIINAIRLSRPRERHVYPHLDLHELWTALDRAAHGCRRAIVVSDGVFSMRGDHAPLEAIVELARDADARFQENVLVVVDDSHGVGAFGPTGRGTEEVCGARADLLVATLGKALGVNGGYAVASRPIVDYLRETSPFYVYSNPIGPAEAAAAHAALDVLDSEEGRGRLGYLAAMTRRLRDGIARLGYRTLEGDHPVVPLMAGGTERTAALVLHLRSHGVLATGLAFPVVPRGEEEIRFQVSAEHTEADIDEVLEVLAGSPDR